MNYFNSHLNTNNSILYDTIFNPQLNILLIIDHFLSLGIERGYYLLEKYNYFFFITFFFTEKQYFRIQTQHN